MRVAIVGATGNLGTSLLAALADEPTVEEIVAIARRPAALGDPRAHFVVADIARDDLTATLRGVDAVVHLAWLIQPSHDEPTMRATNVDGTRRLLDAVAAADVRTLVYASSVGAYAAGPKDRRVDERWPTDGIPTLAYARHKAAVERMLDRFERDRPDVRVVRFRPGLMFKREAATEVRRLFVGPLLPSPLVRPPSVPAVPDHPRLRVQALHSREAGDAFRRALVADVRGAFNLAAEPVLEPRTLAEAFDARPIRVRAGVLRTLATGAWHARLLAADPAWLDVALGVPLMDVGRARRELGWTPRVAATDALLELVDGLRARADHPTPPLARATSGPFRAREVRTGVGATV